MWCWRPSEVRCVNSNNMTPREIVEALNRHIIGQQEAKRAVAIALRNRYRRAQLPDEIREEVTPKNILMIGPTGVGKTELVKCLANDLFDSVDSLIRLDMSEYMEKHTVSKLIGSPPGYIGYDEAGQLTEKIRRKPYAVILFDEIEKAHPDVLNVLLQVLDDGRITDAQGRTVNFENTIIVMTSNAGSDRKDGSVGFGRTLTEQSKEKAMKALSEFLRPEFLNRIDEIITFSPLSTEILGEIAKLLLDDLAEAMRINGLTLTYDPEVCTFAAKASYSETFGARELRRYLQKHVEDEIASLLISSYQNKIKNVHVSVQDDALAVREKTEQ